MIAFLSALSVICVLTGACQTPRCIVKNNGDATGTDLSNNNKKEEEQRNFIVDLSNKTIVFWCKIQRRAGFRKCGILDEKGHFIEGERSYKNNLQAWSSLVIQNLDGVPESYSATYAETMAFCSTTYYKSELYHTRIYYDGSQCQPLAINISAMEIKHAKIVQQEETPNDSTQTAVLVLLFSALVTLVIFVIILYSSRRKLQRVIKVKTDEYFNPTEHSEPKAMIVTVDEYNTDSLQLVELLVGEKINVVTPALHTQENMLSRHDWLEQMVNECNHFIFIVTKQMEKTLKMLNKDCPPENIGGKESDILMEYEGGTCAYTIALIRNKFIKSLKCSGNSVESCHLVSFEETDFKKVLRSKNGRELFPCIRTHHYNLYSKMRFQFHHARRIIKNIRNIEKRKSKGFFHHESSPSRISSKEMDIEKAFVSMNLSSTHNVDNEIQTENLESDSDIDVTFDLLTENDNDRLGNVSKDSQ